MFDIPYLLVAVIALTLTIILFTHNENIKVPIKVFAITSFFQFIIYVYFAFFETTIEQKQFMARSNVITNAIALSIILLLARWKYK
jgi:uncharacterized membrane protein